VFSNYPILVLLLFYTSTVFCFLIIFFTALCAFFLSSLSSSLSTCRKRRRRRKEMHPLSSSYTSVSFLSFLYLSLVVFTSQFSVNLLSCSLSHFNHFLYVLCFFLSILWKIHVSYFFISLYCSCASFFLVIYCITACPFFLSCLVSHLLLFCFSFSASSFSCSFICVIFSFHILA